MGLIQSEGGDESGANRNASSGVDVSQGCYGDYPLIQSTSKPSQTYNDIKQLSVADDSNSVWIRARMYTSRIKGLC